MRKNILLAFGVLAAVSCVNKEYDITKPVDLTMNLGGQLEMPVPGKSEYSCNLGDIILPDGENAGGFIRKQADGTFLFVIEPDTGLDESYDFPTISADDYSRTVLYPTDSYYVSPGPGGSFSDAVKEVDAAIPFNLTIFGIDSRVDAIREVVLDAGLKISLGTTATEVDFNMKDGFTFILPEYMYVDAESLPSYAALVENSGLRNIIRINGDRPSANSEFTLECKINRLDMSGFTLTARETDKEIVIDSDASAKGPVQLVSASIPAGDEFRLSASAEITDIRATSVTLKSSPLLECDPQEIAIGEIPAAFSDGSMDFELEDIMLYVTADNSTPFDLSVITEISASCGGELKNVALGADDGVTVSAGAANQGFCISESGKCGAASDKKIALEGLAALMSPVPDRILLSGTEVHGSSAKEYVTLHAAENYSFGLSYRIEAPLSFKSLSFKRDEVIDINLNLGNDAGLDDLYLKADFVSTLPLDANLTFIPADSGGVAMKDVTLKCEDENGNETDAVFLPAGELSAPSSKVMKIVVRAAEGAHISGVDKLKVHINASSPDGKTVTLNEKQSISISNMSVGTTGGVFIDADRETSGNGTEEPTK